MANVKNCKHQGFTYTKNGHKNIHFICDLDGEIHEKDYCRKCDYYEPRTPTEKGGGK